MNSIAKMSDAAACLVVSTAMRRVLAAGLCIQIFLLRFHPTVSQKKWKRVCVVLRERHTLVAAPPNFPRDPSVFKRNSSCCRTNFSLREGKVARVGTLCRCCLRIAGTAVCIRNGQRGLLADSVWSCAAFGAPALRPCRAICRFGFACLLHHALSFHLRR